LANLSAHLCYNFGRYNSGSLAKGVYMSAIAVDISEFTTKLKELISSLKRDEEIIITAENRPVAKLTVINGQTQEQPVTPPKRRQAGLSDSIVWISPDFDEPLDDFKEYMP
jgi:antitoxin (DNA-binding transcriptional repressor) of toxin-antitoxin stability system